MGLEEQEVKVVKEGLEVKLVRVVQEALDCARLDSILLDKCLKKETVAIVKFPCIFVSVIVMTVVDGMTPI